MRVRVFRTEICIIQVVPHAICMCHCVAFRGHNFCNFVFNFHQRKVSELFTNCTPTSLTKLLHQLILCRSFESVHVSPTSLRVLYCLLVNIYFPFPCDCILFINSMIYGVCGLRILTSCFDLSFILIKKINENMIHNLIFSFCF